MPKTTFISLKFDLKKLPPKKWFSPQEIIYNINENEFYLIKVQYCKSINSKSKKKQIRKLSRKSNRERRERTIYDPSCL